MKPIRGLALFFAFLLFACQPAALPTVTIIDPSSGQTITLQTDERVPSAILAQAGISLNPNDRLLSKGLPIALDQPITDNPTTLQIRRAANVLILTPQGQQAIQTSAFTVGEALTEAGITIHVNDRIEPPLNSPITNPLTINYVPSIPLTINVERKSLQIQSSARTVGEALAEAGIPLLGLDYSLPSENEALPSDGQIRVVRVAESVVLAQKPIPFESELIASADVPLDQTQILSPGENGLTVQRIRIRYEDGNEISRQTEDETLVRPPKMRTLGYGTKVEIKTATVNGVQIEYWRALQMYATSYSPCRSGTVECHGGTSSGKKLAKGMVGLRYSWYLSMQGQPLYIPGYGFASVEDVCGGCVGKPWIDLGYSDNDWEQWSSWVTVYFLTPVPTNIVYILE
jgi:resuscitation-promoting factor RpfB